MQKKLKFVLCFILVFSFLFTMPSMAFAVESEPDIENELMTCERYNAISIGSIGSSVDLNDYIPDLVAFKNDVLHQFMVDDSNLTDELSKFLEGFKMIYCNMQNIMNNFEVKSVDSSNVPFDPTYHNAIMMEKVEGVESGMIVEVLQKGYIYKDKVIRPAMVKVSE
mgnify:CR=1 FL=1